MDLVVVDDAAVNVSLMADADDHRATGYCGYRVAQSMLESHSGGCI
ncbi:hypothetical protein [Halogeometricum borinquense]|nr:hypothetical protein [Halogeometricum borinquense]